EEMVQQRGSDASVNALDAQISRELAQGKHYSGQVPDGPVADGERRDPPLLDLGVLAAGEGALHRAELRNAKLPGKVGVERDLRASGVDKEGDFVAAVYPHIDQRQRIGF